MDNTNNLKQLNEPNNNYYCIGLDLIRILAMFFVITLHSTDFYGYYLESFNSFSLLAAGFGRYLSFSCVPLFIIMTGYLNCKKTPTFQYYIKLLKYLIEFCLCSVIVALFNRFYLNDNVSLIYVFKKILCFQFPKYGWYINMFVGLYLFAPFLNYIFKSLNNKQILLFLLVLLLVFSNPTISDYWTLAYPLMYYFIGGLLRHKNFNIPKSILFCILILMCIIQVILSNYHILKYSTETKNNLGCVIISVSLFLIFYNLKITLGKKSKEILCKILRTIANASLSTFLISEIFESLTFKMFYNLNLNTFSQRLPYLIYLTPIKFIFSLFCAIVISFLAKYVFKFVSIMIIKIKNLILSKIKI